MSVTALDLLTVGEPQIGQALRELVSAMAAAERATVRATLALGHSLFAVSRPRPRQLRAMPAFAGDVLDPLQTGGDVLVELSGHRGADVRTSTRVLIEAVPKWMLRWQLQGHRPDNRIHEGKSLARNPFHFTEGFGNPPTGREITERTAVRTDQGEPTWAVGGTYQVVRIVRLATELWDKDTVEEQVRIIGRQRDGRWLDGAPADEDPNFAADPQGRLTPLDSHVRLAAPDRRNPPPLVRRSYSYDRGNGDNGLIFSCFQRDLAKGFESVQKRLEGEAMAKYMLTTGGGYFFVPPLGGAWIDKAFRQ
ncbi:Dyp-type peroxidase [Streptomyces formicae]|uniref:Dyp-type peroxidase n=1 Tax=Streptomyces formicae TaxID=1616117 RepID=UPI001F590714|nr:Dyp-type peroxidase [Streptomyces formicae]